MSDPSVQEATQQEVLRRQEQALGEIAEKYATGKGGVEESVNAPTGNAYLLADNKKLEAKKDAKAKRIAKEERIRQMENQEKADEEYLNMNSDDEAGDDDDAELRNIREKRLKVIKLQQQQKLENIGKGHGSYREIVSDEFLQEMCSSERVVCHFYHGDFERCKIMDMHLNKLAQRHIETKFVKINAEKAPFFTAKLLIQTIPTVVFFFDGVGREKIIGFEGLMDDMPEGKEDEWPTILLARRMGMCNIIDMKKVIDDDGIEAAHYAKVEEMKKSIFSGIRADAANQMGYGQEDDDDFDLDNIEDFDFQG
jgi:thiol-disulfide isomerase/thioredoxin